MKITSPLRKTMEMTQKPGKVIKHNVKTQEINKDNIDAQENQKKSRQENQRKLTKIISTPRKTSGNDIKTKGSY